MSRHPLLRSGPILAITTLATLTVATAVDAAPARPMPGPEASTDADFNDDGFHDLAVGVPGENDRGGVQVIYGTASGLNGSSPVDDQFLEWGPGSLCYGSALAWGDFDHDGFHDLAVGDPCFPVYDLENAGLVEVWYGSSAGLDPVRRTWHIDDQFGPVEAGDRYGAALVAADLGFGLQSDLAIGVPGEDFTDGFLRYDDAGAVHVFYGSLTGLTARGTQHWSQGFGGRGLRGIREAGDRFGSSLAAADFGRSAKADLAVGAPGEDDEARETADAGAVNVIYGASGGLTSEANDLFRLTTPRPGDAFGTTLAGGELGRGESSDLAIGAPYRDVASVVDAGAVTVLYGAGWDGLSAVGAQRWHQGLASDSDSRGDWFGYSLAIGNFGKGGYRDLAIGHPGEDIERPGDDAQDGGAVTVLYGRSDGLSAQGSQLWSEDSPGIDGYPEDDCQSIANWPIKGDSFGWSLAAANFGSSWHADLAIGVPFEDREVRGIGCVDSDAGQVHVIYGRDPGLSAAGHQLWWQHGDALKGGTENIDEFGSALQ